MTDEEQPPEDRCQYRDCRHDAAYVAYIPATGNPFRLCPPHFLYMVNRVASESDPLPVAAIDIPHTPITRNG